MTMIRFTWKFAFCFRMIFEHIGLLFDFFIAISDKYAFSGDLPSLFSNWSQLTPLNQGWFLISEMPFLVPNRSFGSFVSNFYNKSLQLEDKCLSSRDGNSTLLFYMLLNSISLKNINLERIRHIYLLIVVIKWR